MYVGLYIFIVLLMDYWQEEMMASRFVWANIYQEFNTWIHFRFILQYVVFKSGIS